MNIPLRPRRTQALRSFFEDNNYGFISVAVDVSRYNISKVFDDWYFSERLTFNYENFILDLINVEPDLRHLWSISSKETQDFRTGEESYGYADPEYELSYINDRWNCAFRMNWLIGLIEKEKNDRAKRK